MPYIIAAAVVTVIVIAIGLVVGRV